MILQRDNTEIYYELSGAENAPLMVFANSLGTNLHIWDKLLPHFSGDWRFLRYDKRGHGKTSCQGAFMMDDLVDDAIALIEAVENKDVIFVGLSIGGLIGLGVCAKRPDLVKSFVLMDSAAKIGTVESWNSRIETVSQKGIGEISDAVMKMWFTKEFREKGRHLPYKQMLESSTLEGYLGCCKALMQTDFRAQAATLTLPTLALVGDQDGSTPPELVAQTAKMFQNSEFKIIPQAGHIPCVEQPEILANIMEDFLE